LRENIVSREGLRV